MAPEAAFEDLVEAFAGRARRGQMMGRPTITVDRKLAACLSEGMLAVWLGRDTDAFAEALALPGAEVFSPGRDRHFYDWVSLPVEHTAHWPRFTELAIQRLEGGGSIVGEG